MKTPLSRSLRVERRASPGPQKDTSSENKTCWAGSRFKPGELAWYNCQSFLKNTNKKKGSDTAGPGDTASNPSHSRRLRQKCRLAASLSNSVRETWPQLKKKR